jgi:hypothetical protein
VEVAADSLLHMNHTDLTFMVHVWNNVHMTASQATSPPSPDQYINDWILSYGPPLRRRFFSSSVSRTHPWYLTQNITEPYVAMIRSNDSSKSNGSGDGSAGMSPVIC